jgi:AcrR family transcriptional regulator
MSARIVDRQLKTSAILRAAAQVFAEQGYQAATIDGIAERAGIGKGTVYEYFKSKQDLFFAVFDDYIAGMEGMARHEAALAPATAAEQVRRAVHSVLAASADARDLFPLVFEFWSASASVDRRERVAGMFRETYARFRELLAALIRQGQQSGEFDPAADASGVAAVLVGALDGLFLQAWFDRALDPVALGDKFVEIVLAGLASKSNEGKDT